MISSVARALLLAPFLLAATENWSQQPVPASSVAGIWLGTLSAGSVTLRIQVHIQTSADGSLTCALDSLDQGAFGIPCNNVRVDGSAVSFDVPAVSGKWAGQLSADGKALSGTWTQGPPLPLVMERQTTAVSGPKAPPPEPAVPPVALADLKAVLDRDLAGQLTGGQLATGTQIGFTVGVVERRERRIFTYGKAKEESVFEIGSITKTFTATILAQMVEQGKVRLDEPVRELLPPGTVAKPNGPEITLLDLSDQHSGLPRMPDNFHPAHPENPYADYNATLLYQFIAKTGVALGPKAPFVYSNLGVGLLGQALANRAKMTYPELLQEQVTGPLGMKDTAVALTPPMQSRFVQGYDGDGNPAHAWDLDALAGAGAIRSTAADMLTYPEAQLHPDKLAPNVTAQPYGKTLPAAIALTHVIQGEASRACTSLSTGCASMRLAITGTTEAQGATVPTRFSTPTRIMH